MQLVGQINSSFEKKNYTRSIFIDLSKAFGNVDQSYKSYLENRKQFIAHENFLTSHIKFYVVCHKV